MAIGIAASDAQGARWGDCHIAKGGSGAEGVRGAAGHDPAAAAHGTAPADTCPIAAVLFQCAEAWRQGAVVRYRLHGASPPLGFVAVAQQPELQHQRTDQLRVELFPASSTQATRQYDIAKAYAD